MLFKICIFINRFSVFFKSRNKMSDPDIGMKKILQSSKLSGSHPGSAGRILKSSKFCGSDRIRIYRLVKIIRKRITIAKVTAAVQLDVLRLEIRLEVCIREGEAANTILREAASLFFHWKKRWYIVKTNFERKFWLLEQKT